MDAKTLSEIEPAFILGCGRVGLTVTLQSDHLQGTRRALASSAGAQEAELSRGIEHILAK